MNIEDFKMNMEKYKNGSLSEKDVEKFEQELEKLDEYQNLLEKEFEHPLSNSEYENELENKILKKSKLFAYIRIALSAFIAALFILPILNLISGMYYNIGDESSKSKMIQNVINTAIPITNPNIIIDNLRDDSFFFKKNYTFDLYKEMEGKQDFVISDGVSVAFTHAKRERNILPNEDFKLALKSKDIQNHLAQLDEHSIVNLYVTFDCIFKPEEVSKIERKYHIEAKWHSVKTDELDDGSEENFYLIGYPKEFNFGQNKQVTSAQDSFKEALKYLSNYEDLTKSITNNRLFSIKQKYNYLEQNGILINGLFLEGTAKEMKNFINEQEKFISNIYLGVERIW